jgi:hypothetical protein
MKLPNVEDLRWGSAMLGERQANPSRFDTRLQRCWERMSAMPSPTTMARFAAQSCDVNTFPKPRDGILSAEQMRSFDTIEFVNLDPVTCAALQRSLAVLAANDRVKHCIEGLGW